MNKTIKTVIVFVFFMAIGVNSASAQFKLKDLVKSTTSTETSSNASSSSDASASTENKIKKEDFHKYEARKIYITDENGARIKTAAGTDSCVVKLFDMSTETPTMVSAEAIKDQRKAINNAILRIAAKALAGGVGGGLSGDWKKALIGMAAGIGLSVDDIYTIISLKKDMSKQNKALDAYEKSFNEEGQQIVAELDKDSKKALGDLDKTASEMKASDLMAEMEKDSYTTVPSNSSIDALTAAADKILD